MKTYNIIYKTDKQLEDFVRQNLPKNTSDKILVQMFVGVMDKDFIEYILDKIKELLPNVKIVGTTTGGEIKDGEIFEESVVLSFSVFENTIFKTIIYLL